MPINSEMCQDFGIEFLSYVNVHALLLLAVYQCSWYTQWLIYGYTQTCTHIMSDQDSECNN